MATELISLGILFLCAIIGGIIATRFNQPAVFGLLLVGALIGPNMLNLVNEISVIKLMAEFGAMLILFVIGLEFDISKLMKLGARSILIGLLKFAIVLFLGYEATLLLGFSSKVALFVGVVLSFSSTVVVVKVLEQKEMFSRKEVPLLVAVLIIEDLLAVFALTFFSGAEASGIGLLSTFEHILFSIAALLLAYFVMMKIVGRAAGIILKNNHDESVTIFLSLGMMALFSYFAFYLGFTPSAGAFLAGSLLASLPNSKEYGRAIHPYTLIFTSIFFISMGTLVDFKVVESNIIFIAALIVTIFVSRFIAVGFLTFLLANFRNEQPFFSSIAMISVGEFSLLVAKESEKFNLGVDLVTITAAIIFITAILMSVGINYSSNAHSFLNARMPIKARLKLERISNYLRGFFDQLETENFFTKKLRAEANLALVLIILATAVFFVLRRIALAIELNSPVMALYPFYALSMALMAYLLFLVYKRLRAVHYTLAVILTHVDASRNLKKCTKIINDLSLALMLFFSAMLFPFAMFAFSMGQWANIMPFVLVAAASFYVRNLVALVDCNSHYIPAYNPRIAAVKS